MQRREFLKAMIALSASSIMPIPKFILADELFNDKNYIDAGFNVRELIAYDLIDDRYLSRYDISTKTQHYCVTCILDDMSKLQEIRNEATKLLKETMIKNEIGIGDLIYMPIPSDYVRPKEFI